MLTVIEKVKADELHKKATKIVIERTREKLGVETVEEVFDIASGAKKKTTAEAWNAFDHYEYGLGHVPNWIFDFCLDCLAGRYNVERSQ